jgi:hypothetical protein
LPTEGHVGFVLLFDEHAEIDDGGEVVFGGAGVEDGGGWRNLCSSLTVRRMGQLVLV